MGITRTLGWLTLANLIGAALTWMTLIVAARSLGPEAYTHFNVLWAFYFAGAGALLGLQQEVARGLSRQPSATEPGRGTGISVIGGSLIVGGCIAGLSLLTVPAWGATSIVGNPIVLVTILVGSLVSLAVQCGLVGAMAASGLHAALGGLVVGSAAIRLVLTALVTANGAGSEAVLAAISAGSFSWLLLLTWPRARSELTRSIRSRTRPFLKRAGSVMVSTSCAGLLASSFPLLIDVFSPSRLGAGAGIAFAAIILTRTPLLLPLSGIQTVLVPWLVHAQPQQRWRELALPGFVGGCAYIAAAALAGPPILALVFGPDFSATRIAMGALAASAVLLAILTLTGVSTVARGRHVRSTTGWVAATTVTSLGLMVSLPVIPRCALSLSIGSAVGIAIHCFPRGHPTHEESSGHKHKPSQ